MKLESRPLEVADLPAVLKIEKKSNPIPWNSGMFSQEIENRISRFYVFEHCGEITGYGGYWDMVGHGHISNIAVHPEARRQGFGREIISCLIADMAGHGIVAATLEVRESNRPAAALYESCGFHLEGCRKRYYRNGEDALIYSKEL